MKPLEQTTPTASPQLRVLLFDQDTQALDAVRTGLQSANTTEGKTGCKTDIQQLDCLEQLYSRIVRDQPDVVILSVAAPSAALLQDIGYINRDCPLPLVMFSADGSADSVRRSLDAGVTTYVYDGLAANRIAAVVEAARLRHASLSRLQHERDAARASLADRKLIERAKGIVMRRLQLDEQDAYQRLRKLAMDRHIRMATLAASIVEAAASEAEADAG